MKQWRNALMALVVASCFLGISGKAQAVVGIPDDVPANTLLFPFFKVDPVHAGFLSQDTLLTITNTSAFAQFVHVSLWDRHSDHQLNFNVVLTHHDVFSCSMWDLILGGLGCLGAQAPSPAPQQVINALTVCAGPTGLSQPIQNPNFPPNDPLFLVCPLGQHELLVGYVTADIVSLPTTANPGDPGYPLGIGLINDALGVPADGGSNVLIGHQYLVNLPAGDASGFNAVGIEWVTQNSSYPAIVAGVLTPVAVGPVGFSPVPSIVAEGQNAVSVAPAGTQFLGFYLNKCIENQLAPCLYDHLERIDGLNGDAVQTGTSAELLNGDCTIQGFDCSNLNLLFRYLTAPSVNANTGIWIWKDRNALFAFLAIIFPTFVPDDGSVNIAMWDEAENPFSIPYFLPDEVNFLDVKQVAPGVTPGGWFRVKYTPLPFFSILQSVGYSVQTAANANASLSWQVAFPAHRHYTYYLGNNGLAVLPANPVFE